MVTQKRLTQTALGKLERNEYNELIVDFDSAIAACYPDLVIQRVAPGCWGDDGELGLYLPDDSSQWVLQIPSGKYRSTKHYHNSYTGIAAVESSRKKLNLPGCPLYLIVTTAFNGDYRSLKKSYFLFGKNEDNSYFAHKVRPKIGATGDLDLIRAWMWELKEGEKIASRQGDLAFIPKTNPKGTEQEDNAIAIGNHNIIGEQIRKTAKKTYALNPLSTHHEHYQIELKGWYELRLARVWTVRGRRGRRTTWGD